MTHADVSRFCRFAVSLALACLALGTARATAAAPCPGDCNQDGTVTVDEIVTMANIALGIDSVSRCQAGDVDHDGRITVSEIITAVNAALNGCSVAQTPTATPTASLASSPTPTQTPLQGADVVQGASRAALSTMQSISILDFGYVYAGGQASPSEVPQFRLAGTAPHALLPDSVGSAAAVPATNCDSGSATVTCTAGNGTSSLTVVYTNCQTKLVSTAASHTLLRRGSVTQTVASATFCDTHTVPPDAAVSLHLNAFTLAETDDASGTELVSIRTTVTDAFTPNGGSCSNTTGPALVNGKESIDGSQSFRCEPSAEILTCPPGGADTSLSVRSLVLDRAAAGSPCELNITLHGTLETHNLLTGERFAEKFGNTRITEAPAPGVNAGTTFTIEGQLHEDCLGDIDLQTHRPILMRGGAKCPSDGVLQLAAPLVGAGVPAAGTSAAVDTLATASGLEPAASNLSDLAARSDPTGSGPAESTLAAGPSAIDQNAGFRQAVFRAANGTTYQVLQNVAAAAALGAEDFQVTTLVGSADALGACEVQAEPGVSGEAVVAAVSGAAIGSGLVVKSSHIADVSVPCFDPRGDGAVCIGAECTNACQCPAGAACALFTQADGFAVARPTTDIAPAKVVADLTDLGKFCSGFQGAMTYGFGLGGPTTQASLCAPVPQDGFALPRGTSVIFAYQTPLATRFSVGYAGFPVDRDGKNPFMCHRDTVVGAGPAVPHETLPPPMVRFTSGGQVAFDFNQDAVIDRVARTCEDTALFQCAPVPVPTPEPNPSCPQIDLASMLSVTHTGSTAGAANGLGGASCGLGGNAAPDVAFAYTAPATGFYIIDTIGSDFDTVLYVRDGSCSGAELACNDDRRLRDSSSQVGIALNEGQHIVIVVDGFAAASGSYALHVAFAAATPTPSPTPTPGLPDLVITQLTAPTMAAVGDTITVSVAVANQGAADAGPFQVSFVYSTSSIITLDDIPSGVDCIFAGLAAGATATCTQPIAVVSSLTPRTYFVGAIADPTGQVVESDITNNTRAADTGPLVVH